MSYSSPQGPKGQHRSNTHQKSKDSRTQQQSKKQQSPSILSKSPICVFGLFTNPTDVRVQIATRIKKEIINPAFFNLILELDPEHDTILAKKIISQLAFNVDYFFENAVWGTDDRALKTYLTNCRNDQYILKMLSMISDDITNRYNLNPVSKIMKTLIEGKDDQSTLCILDMIKQHAEKVESHQIKIIPVRKQKKKTKPQMEVIFVQEEEIDDDDDDEDENNNNNSSNYVNYHINNINNNNNNNNDDDDNENDEEEEKHEEILSRFRIVPHDEHGHYEYSDLDSDSHQIIIKEE